MIEIRAARTEDDAALAEIDAATWGPDVSPAPPVEPGAPFFSEHRPPADTLVAEVDGAVVGYATLHQVFPVPSHRHVLEINGLAVAPASQGRGVGRKLLEATAREATRRGATKLTLRVLGHNATARRLYESCGLVVEGVLRDEFDLDGRLVDDVIMARRLG